MLYFWGCVMVQMAKKWISYFWKMVQHEIAENPKILCSANFLDPFTTYITVSAPYLSYSLSYSQLKSGSQVWGGEILDTEIEFSQHWGSVKSSYWHQWTSHTSYQLKLSLAENRERWTTKSCRSNSVKKHCLTIAWKSKANIEALLQTVAKNNICYC